MTLGILLLIGCAITIILSIIYVIITDSMKTMTYRELALWIVSWSLSFLSAVVVLSMLLIAIFEKIPNRKIFK